MPRQLVIVPRRILIPLGISWALMFILCIQDRNPAFIYYALMIGGGGFVLSRYQGECANYLRAIPVPALLRFVLCGYAAVITEEILVGFLFTLKEGFSFSLLAERVAQFVSFNVLAFTGLICGGYIFVKNFGLRCYDVLLILGGWGLFSEHIVTMAFTNPILAVVMLLPTICVYAVIMLPACLSQEQSFLEKEKFRPFWQRLLAFWVITFMASVPPIMLLEYLRHKNPDTFPSCHYIPCDNEEEVAQPPK